MRTVVICTHSLIFSLLLCSNASQDSWRSYKLHADFWFDPDFGVFSYKSLDADKYSIVANLALVIINQENNELPEKNQEQYL